MLIAVGIAVYANGFSGVFLFDDEPHIINSDKVKQLWPPWHLLATRRPVLYVSLAVNFAAGGLSPWGYHLVNLTVHVLAALTLFGVVHRTLPAAPLRVRFASAARPLACAVALVWLVHPLQTQSVTYIIQRSESLMGLFYLLTVYCVIRGAGAPRRTVWYLSAIMACAMGMGSKGVMITAPLVVMLYDRTFLAGSFHSALRSRWGLYLGLAATWAVLLACGVLQSVLSPRTSMTHVGFGYRGISPVSYLFTQPEVLVHYVRLALLPTSLCLDYNWPAVQPAEAMTRVWFWVGAILILTALGKTAWDTIHNRPASLLGVWFFIILAPTSSYIPIKDPAFEHRMYLPLASIVVLVVLGGYRIVGETGERFGIGPRRVAVALAVALLAWAAPLAHATMKRNETYRSTKAMWLDVRSKRPENYRAHMGVGAALHKTGRLDEAIAAYREALSIKDQYADGHYNLALALAAKKEIPEAIDHYRAAIRLNPNEITYYTSFIKTLIDAGRYREAVDVATVAAKRDPSRAPMLNEMAEMLFDEGKWDDAAYALRRVLEFFPDHMTPQLNLGHVLRSAGRLDPAVEAYEEAIRVDPANPEPHIYLAQALVQRGDVDRAAEILLQAVKLDPDSAEVRYNLGSVYNLLGRRDGAIAELRRAVDIDPTHAAARHLLDSLEAAP
jgi:tetratricopeptide (TPR) repeat protein